MEGGEEQKALRMARLWCAGRPAMVAKAMAQFPPEQERTKPSQPASQPASQPGMALSEI